MSTDLVAWLRQQLDTDEQVARAAADAPHGARTWTLDSFIGGDLDPGEHVCLNVGDNAITASTGTPRDDDDPLTVGELRHIANFDPARALAEVESKRAILGLLERVVDYPPYREDYTGAHALDDAIRLLAASYRDRPGYRDEWRHSAPS